jgi:chloramphenicol-sensitive protein RarD
VPIYFKLVQAVSSEEILLHRVIWAVPFGMLIVHLRGQWPEVRRALTHRAMLGMLATSAFFVAVNWYIYIIAVQSDRIFQASLGYYINPLIFVLVGVVFLGERLRRLQLGAVLLAAAGVLVLTFSGGEFPFIALAVGVSFTTYGVIRKKVVIGAMPGLFVETLVLAPVALAWLGWLMADGTAVFGEAGPGMTAMIVLAGPITVVPLLFFAVAARRLTLTTIGFMQFIAPTLQFCTGLYYGERLTLPRLICFGLIWTAVTLFSIDALRGSRRRESAPAAV